MDYFSEAFGGFEPHQDVDGAIKFSLDGLFYSRRLDRLATLLTKGHEMAGVEGEPGWIIERRDEGEDVGYESWPIDTGFRCYVDPEVYSLKFPEYYCDRVTFLKYVESILGVYIARFPEDIEQYECILSLLDLR